MTSHKPPVYVGEDEDWAHLHSHVNTATEEASDEGNIPTIYRKWALPGGSAVKNPPASAGNVGSICGSRRSPGGGNRPTPVFFPGKSHEQRRLAGYSPWDHKESDMT